MKNVKLTMNNEKRREKRERWKMFLLFSFFIFHFSLFICTCDLFNGEVQDNFIEKIDEDIRWANAARLTVRVDYSPLWGSSPQQGALNRETTRQGYAFDVEFTPAPGYGFVGWFAFRTNELDLTNIDEHKALNGNDVNIVPDTNAAGAQTAKVTINITDPVTLVPFCSDHPRLSQKTNPPLNPILMSFPYDQRIDIWFNMPVKREDLELDKDKKNITISGRYLINRGEYSRGDLFEGHGDITEYYKPEFPKDPDSPGELPEFVNQVTLVPIEQTASSLSLLTITVSVGPDIKNENGVPMVIYESFSFMTDSSKTQKGYRANNIVVQSRDESRLFGDSQPFNNAEIDRRFRSGTTIYMEFTIDMMGSTPPDTIRIIEQMVYKLDGFPFSGSPLPEEELTTFSIRDDKYSLNYELKTKESGIIRLLVLPWDKPTNIPPLEPDEAIAEGRYVTIVIDDEAPSLPNPGVILSNHYNSAGTRYAYGTVQAAEGVIVTLEELGSISDNSTGGVPHDRAWSYPWTMNEKLFWKIMLGNESEGIIESEWEAVYNGSVLNNQWKSGDISELAEQGVYYQVYLRFKDSLDNQTEWKETGYEIVHTNVEVYPITNLKAECDTAGTSITVSWTEPTDDVYEYPEIEIRKYIASVSGDIFESQNSFELTKTGSYSIPAVTQISTNNVLNGNAVTGVYGYEISVIAHNRYGDIKTGPIWVYNIPGMVTDTSTTNTINTIRIESSNQLTLTGTQLSNNTNIVLTSDITIAVNHIPIGTFSGKFYGNGHTVTISGMDTSSTVMGLFGIANNALIRDLTVAYGNTNVYKPGDSDVFIGGITGQANNTTQISNCMVNGSLTVSSTAKIHLGGIAGTMNPAALVENCYSRINLFATETGNGIICAGGIAGQIWNTAPNVSTKLMINGARAAGTIIATNNSTSSTGSFYLGGIVGECRGLGIIQNTTFSGTLTMTANSTGTGSFNYICGGIIGRMQDGNLTAPLFSGTITIPDTHSTAKETLVGGVVGTAGHDRAISGTNGAKITVNNATAQGSITINSKASGTITVGGVCAASDASSSTIVFDNGEYRTGRISVGSTNSILGNIGGFVGEYKNYTTFTNCKANAAGININFDPGTDTTKNITLNAGGFAGIAITGGPQFNGLNSTSPIVVNIGAFRDAVLRVGGFVGYHNGGRITNCIAGGSVTVTSNHTNNTTEIQIGGLGGVITGIPTINSSSASGNVAVTIGTSSKDVILLRTGGFVGYQNTGTIANCFASGSVTVTSNHTNNTTGIQTGGFGGETNVPIDSSYALGNVAVTIGASSKNVILRTGGFVGYLTQTAATALSITKCFARGSVTVNTSHTGSSDIYTGGFGGYIKSTGGATSKISIENSYTTGAVKVDKKAASSPIGPIKTGGFVGLMEGPGGTNKSTINRSFTAGDVVSLYNWTVGGPVRYNEAGGFAGGLGDTDATQCVVAGGNIWAVGGDAMAWRFVAGHGNATLMYNFGNIGVRYYFYSIYSNYNSASPPQGTQDTGVGNSNENAWTVPTDNLKSWDNFWGKAINTSDAKNGGPAFSNSVWDSGSQSRGYPLLLNMGGQ
jgi:hypothetical protein